MGHCCHRYSGCKLNQADGMTADPSAAMIGFTGAEVKIMDREATDPWPWRVRAGCTNSVSNESAFVADGYELP